MKRRRSTAVPHYGRAAHYHQRSAAHHEALGAQFPAIIAHLGEETVVTASRQMPTAASIASMGRLLLLLLLARMYQNHACRERVRAVDGRR